jgi:RHS repeat-associated protein
MGRGRAALAVAILWVLAPLAAAQTFQKSVPEGYTPNWVATPTSRAIALPVKPFQKSAAKSSSYEPQSIAYYDTSLTACPAGERLEYFYTYSDIPALRASSWCGAAQADLDVANATDPLRWRVPYLLESCTAGQVWYYSHALSGGNRYYSPGYRGVNMVCSVGPLTISLAGPTHALPLDAGGQTLRLTATVTQSGASKPGVGVTVSMIANAGGSVALLSPSTGSNGQVSLDYTPPQTLLGQSKSDQIRVDCAGCSNSANMAISVQGTPLTPQGSQSCPADPGLATAHPILPATGIKILQEQDWHDAGPHPLSLTRYYASRWTAQPRAGLGTSWNHNHAHRLFGAGVPASSSRTVLYGDGSVSRFLNTAPVVYVDPNSGGIWQCPQDTWCTPPLPVIDPNANPPQWSAQGSQDSMSDTAQGVEVLRASDDSRWLFDNTTGQVLRAEHRNGWAYQYSYSNGLLSRISNTFGRELLFAYDTQGRLMRVATPDGQAISYTFEDLRLGRVDYSDNTFRRYLHEDSRWPEAITGLLDEAGNRYGNYSYDAQGRAVLSELAGGVDRSTVAYSSSGSAVTDALGMTRTYQYQALSGAASGMRTRQASSLASDGNAIASQVFTGDSLLASQTDFMGVGTLFTWDAARRLPVSETRAADRPEAQTTQIQWHPTFRLPALVTEAGRTTAYSYDSLGNKLSETVTDTTTGQARTWSWTYSDKGLAETMTDPKGGTWRHGYDAAGNRTSSRNPLGQQTSYSYDAAGRVLSETEPNGLVTAYSYDARGRLVSLNRGGEVSGFSYAPTGQLTGATLPNGFQVNYSYDAAQRLTGATDNRGNSVSYTLDAMGNRTREEVRDGTGAIALVTGRIIDSLNKVAAIQGSLGQTTALAYDVNGEPIAQTDPLNQTTRQGLDGLRRPTATTFADNAFAEQAWNQLNQLTQVTDPKGVKTVYETNAFGEVARESSPDIGAMSYARDANGEVIAVQDAKGATSAITRDALGRPTEIRHAPDHVAYFSYDPQAGYLNKIEDKSGSTRYERDIHGRITAKTQAVNDNPNNPIQLKVGYGYQGGELASVSYPSGLKVLYRRSAGRITDIDVQEPAGTSGKTPAITPFVTGLTHTALGQPRSWSWKNGDTASRSFDADGRMTQSEIASYSYDAASRITGITQSLWAERTVTAVVNGKSQTVTELYQTPISWTAGYDMRNRLTSFARAGASTVYSYDANSNRLTAVDQTTSEVDLEGAFDQPNFTQSASQNLSIDSGSNKLLGFTQTVTRTQAGGTTSSVTSQVNYSLDANGAMTSDGLRTFEYDESRRLAKVKVIKDGEAAAVEYLHNALGQRVFKSEPKAEQTLPNEEDLGPGFINWLRKQFGWLFTQGNASKASIGMAFVYGDDEIPEWALLGEYDNGSALGKGGTEYVWLPTDDGSAIPIGLYRNGKFYQVHSDHLGTPRLITDTDKKPVWQWPYSAFGNNQTSAALTQTVLANGQTMLKSSKAVVEVNLRFPGQYFDSESGLNQNWNREYNARLGRYIQSDPIGLEGGINTFGYVDGNPLSAIDPTGEFANLLIGAGIGLAFDLVTQLAQNGGNLKCIDLGQLAMSTALGAVGGGLGGRGLTGFLKGLSNKTKGGIGESLSVAENTLKGSTQAAARNSASIPGQSTLVDSTWRSWSGTLYYTESKFGMSTLTKPQQRAAKALGDSYRLERWGYDFFGRAGSYFGATGTSLVRSAADECECKR